MSWANGYSRCVLVTLNVHPSSNLSAFPNLVIGINGSTPFPPFAQFADVAHGGYVQHTVTLLGQTVPADLIFTSDAAGTTLLSWEIESWNNATGAIVAWVNSDRLAASDTLVYAWIGKSSVTTYQCTASATWDGNYIGVWHLGNGSVLSGIDSTDKSHNATTVTAGVATGQIDGAALFDGTSAKQVTQATVADYQMGAQNWTVEMWVKPSANIGGNYVGLIGQGTYQVNGWYWTISPTGILYCATESGGVDLPIYTAAGVVAIGVWQHFVGVRNGLTTGIIYKNGAPVTTYGSLITPANSAFPFYIGTDSAVHWVTGPVDEVRISNTNRSANWIAHEYRQQAQASAFFAVTDLGSGISIPLLLEAYGDY